MIEREYVLNNLQGLHARPASLLVQAASRSKSEVTLIKNSKEYNAKSILGILSLGARKGDNIQIRIEGADEAETVAEIEALFAGNFGE